MQTTKSWLMQNIYNDWSLSLINFRLCDDISNCCNACFELTYIIQISSNLIILFQQSFKHKFLITLYLLRLIVNNIISSNYYIILLSSYLLLHLQQRLKDLNYKYKSFELIIFVSFAVRKLSNLFWLMMSFLFSAFRNLSHSFFMMLLRVMTLIFDNKNNFNLIIMTCAIIIFFTWFTTDSENLCLDCHDLASIQR